MTMCSGCPFNYGNPTSEVAQNLGCLPTPWEIMDIKRNSNKNWSCHEDETKLCPGFIERAKELKLNYKEGSLGSYEAWYYTGKA